MKFSQILACRYCDHIMNDSDRTYLDKVDKIEVVCQNCGKRNEFNFYTTENVANEKTINRKNSIKNT